MTGSTHFPRLRARDLTGREQWTPDAFEGNANLVFVAFRRQQQSIIDSWVPWLDVHATSSSLRFYEVPVLARWWAPIRPVIDGGMAAAIRDLEARRRTLTVYGDVATVTRPLAITDQATVSIFLVAGDGEILERATGSFDQATATRLEERAQQ